MIYYRLVRRREHALVEFVCQGLLSRSISPLPVGYLPIVWGQWHGKRGRISLKGDLRPHNHKLICLRIDFIVLYHFVLSYSQITSPHRHFRMPGTYTLFLDHEQSSVILNYVHLNEMSNTLLYLKNCGKIPQRSLQLISHNFLHAIRSLRLILHCVLASVTREAWAIMLPCGFVGTL